MPKPRGINSKKKHHRRNKKKNDNDFDELSSILNFSKKNKQQKSSIKGNNNKNGQNTAKTKFNPNKQNNNKKNKNKQKNNNKNQNKKRNQHNRNESSNSNQNIGNKIRQTLSNMKTNKGKNKEMARKLAKIEEIRKLQSSLANRNNNNSNNNSNDKNKEKDSRVPEYVDKSKQNAMAQRLLAARQLSRMPNEILIPKCSLCGLNMVVARGDSAYDEFESVTCDYCGRENIRGEVWHCPKGIVKSKTIANEHLRVIHGGFDLCKSCAFLIPRGRQHEIRRAGPPTDDLGLLLRNKQRNRRTTEDGYKIYKFKEIQDVLKIGQGGGTPLCPFDCDCCF